MSIEKSNAYMGENKTILELAGELFQNINVKVSKADISSSLVDGRLKAGTILSKDGKVVDGTTITDDKAYGLVYSDINFTNSNGKETVPVTIFGFIKESTLPKAPSPAAKTAMKMLLFM
jgi:hypothetical protein